MKKTISLLSIVIAVLMLLCACSLTIKPAKAENKSNLSQDVMTYFDGHTTEINQAISQAGFGGIISTNDLRTPLQTYVANNETNILNFIESIKGSSTNYDQKKSMVAEYLYNALYSIVDSILEANGYKAFGITADLFSTQMRGFANTYAGSLVEEYKDLLASMISDGSLFYVLAILIEAVIVVALIVLCIKKNKTGKPNRPADAEE